MPASVIVAAGAGREVFDFDKSKPAYIFIVCLLAFICVAPLVGMLLVDLRRKWRGDSSASAASASTAIANAAPVGPPLFTTAPAAPCRAGSSCNKTSTTDSLPTTGLPKVEGFSFSPTQTPPSRPSLQHDSTEGDVEASDGGEVPSGSTTEAASSVYRESAGRRKSGLKSLQAPGYRVESMTSNHHHQKATMDCVVVSLFVLFAASVVVSIALVYFMVGVINADWGVAPEDLY
ncbi:hypothetical protein PspLS_05601, partial [Pyricularia sp. CBS 133598]